MRHIFRLQIAGAAKGTEASACHPIFSVFANRTALLSYQGMPELFQTNKMEKQKISSFNERSLRQIIKRIALIAHAGVPSKSANKISHFLRFCLG